MFASILPGLRDLRTPLASGYVFLAGLWVLIAEDIPKKAPTHGFLAQVYRLDHGLGTGALIAALSFAAYMIGTLLTVSPGFLNSGFLRAHSIFFVAPRETHKQPAIRKSTVLDAHTLLRESAVALDDAWTKAKLSERMAYATSTSDDIHGGRPNLLGAVVAEVRQLIPRLHEASKDLFDDYDRLHAEAEFRLTVAIPISFLSASLAIKWSPWFWAGMLLLPLLVFYSFAKERAANDVVIQALCIGTIKSAAVRRAQTFIELVSPGTAPQLEWDSSEASGPTIHINNVT